MRSYARVTLEYPCTQCPGTHKMIVSVIDCAAKKSVLCMKRKKDKLPAKTGKATSRDSNRTRAIKSREQRNQE